VSDTRPDAADPTPDDAFRETLAEVLAVADDLTALMKQHSRVTHSALNREDAERLTWARLSGWSLTQTRDAFTAVDSMESTSEDELFVRLLASKGDMSMEDAREFIDTVRVLHDRYPPEDHS